MFDFFIKLLTDDSIEHIKRNRHTIFMSLIGSLLLFLFGFFTILNNYNLSIIYFDLPTILPLFLTFMILFSISFWILASINLECIKRYKEILSNKSPNTIKIINGYKEPNTKTFKSILCSPHFFNPFLQNSWLYALFFLSSLALLQDNITSLHYKFLITIFSALLSYIAFNIKQYISSLNIMYGIIFLLYSLYLLTPLNLPPFIILSLSLVITTLLSYFFSACLIINSANTDKQIATSIIIICGSLLLPSQYVLAGCMNGLNLGFVKNVEVIERNSNKIINPINIDQNKIKHTKNLILQTTETIIIEDPITKIRKVYDTKNHYVYFQKHERK